MGNVSEELERSESLRRILNITAFTPVIALSPYLLGKSIEPSNRPLGINIQELSIITAPGGVFILLLLLILAANNAFKKPALKSPLQHSKQMKWALISTSAPFATYLGLFLQILVDPVAEVEMIFGPIFYGSMILYFVGLFQIVRFRRRNQKQND
jgi:uncharacterized integral membrane protein